MPSPVVTFSESDRRNLWSWEIPIDYDSWLRSRERLARKAVRWGGYLRMRDACPPLWWHAPGALESNMESQKRLKELSFREYRYIVAMVPWGCVTGIERRENRK